MQFLSLALILFQTVSAPQPLAPIIESCDGTTRGGSSSTHGPGEEWFSLTGRVLDPAGLALCGESITLEYLVEVSTPHGLVSGPTSLIGRDGVFFLDNVRKGTPFKVHVNPYESAERLVQREGIEAIAARKVAGKALRTGGLERFESEELRSVDASGLVTLNFQLKADPTATGMILGNVGTQTLDRDVRSFVRIRAAGRGDIEANVDWRGNFVAIGIPAGQHEVMAEFSVGHRKRSLQKTVSVAPGANAMTRVSLAEK